MTMYRVSWEIDIEAETPYLAAMEALAIQRDETSIATVFRVTDRAKPNARPIVVDVEPGEASA